MELDDHVCLCFHVSKRKLANFIRIEKPRRVGQISQCQGAGTGCGWCRPFLQQMFEQQINSAEATDNALKDRQLIDCEYDLDAMTPGQYAAFRKKYVKQGHGTPPPGAAPIEDGS